MNRFCLIALWLLCLPACDGFDLKPRALGTPKKITVNLGPTQDFGSASGKKSQKKVTTDEKVVIEDLTSDITANVNAGFDSREEIIESAIESYSNELDAAVLKPLVQKTVDEAFDKLRKEQATWPAVTDCDRLDQAFAALDIVGVIARQNFSDCGTCGVAEIEGEMAAAKKTGRKVRGYVFYHQQDTEAAADGRVLYLNYGSVLDDKQTHVDIGHEVVKVLESKGLKTEWNGDLAERIGIKLDWKRRRAKDR